METAAVEAESTEPVIEATTALAPGLGTTVAPELSAEVQIDLHPEASTDIVVREAAIEEAMPLRLEPMPET
jgi:hypothetical protein